MKSAASTIVLLLILFCTGFAEQPQKVSYGPNLLISNPDITVYRANEREIPRYVEGRLSDPISKGDETIKVIEFFEEKPSY